jgi:hypothetical protein
MKKSIAFLLTTSLLTAGGCATRDDGGADSGARPRADAGSEMPPASGCPEAEGLTVCDLKLDGGAKQPAVDDAVELRGVLVTSPVFTILRDAMTDAPTLQGFFVADVATTEDLAGRYAGILVTFGAGRLTGAPPQEGELVNLQGTFRVFGRDGFEPKQKQLQASFVELVSDAPSAIPVEVDDPSAIATGGARAAGLEGVLVTVRNVTAAIVRDVPGATPGNSIFGAFQLAGGLVVSGTIFQYQAVANEEFESITGILRVGTAPFDAGVFMLSPRTSADVVSKTPKGSVTSIRQLQDPAAAGRPDICINDGMLVGRCPDVELSGVVVTAKGGYVSANLRALWVQDPAATDGRFAGVKVVYGRDAMGYIPDVGHKVDVRGQAIIFRGGMQVQFPSFTRVGETTETVTPIEVSPTDIVRTETETNAYEGVLVRIGGVTVTERCVDSNNRDFGNWVVTGPVLIGTAFTYGYNGRGASCPEGQTCNCAAMTRTDDQRREGDAFESITGVLNHGFDELRLEPRGPEDLVTAR